MPVPGSTDPAASILGAVTTSRGIDRLLAIGDATVAIATLAWQKHRLGRREAPVGPVLMLVALVVAVSVDVVGTWALLVLLLERPIRRVTGRRA